MSHSASPRRARSARSARSARAPLREPGVGASLLWTTLGTVVPGLGLLRRRDSRTLGLAVCGAVAVAMLLLLTRALIAPGSLLHLAVDPTVLLGLTVALPLVALGWLGLIVLTWQRWCPGALSPVARTLGSVVVGVLSFAVAAPLAVASRYAYDQYQLVERVFSTGASGTRPPITSFAGRDRVNVLLLGGDRAAPTQRTDTMMVASIDTRTGNTALIGLPRNTANMPFPADSPLHRYFPHGFTSGDPADEERMANTIYEHVPELVPANVLGPTDNLGADALKLSIGEAFGLPIDYYVMVNFDGFKELINALGGITVNVNDYIAVGGGNTTRNIPPPSMLRPGPNQHLNGRQGLWFARGRFGADDYQRMDRQRCVIDAVIRQANPSTMLQHYEAISRAGRDLVRTDIPQPMLGAFLELSLRVKDARTQSLIFTPGVDGFRSADPDFARMRRDVQGAIAASETTSDGTPTPASTPGASPTTRPTSRPTTRPTVRPTPARPSSTPRPATSGGLSDACAFDPARAAAARPIPGVTQIEQTR